MSDIFIAPGKLSGEITVPPSKSVAHRAMICAALAGDKKLVSTCSEDLSVDIFTTCEAIKALTEGKDEIFCNESGSTLRFLIPIAAALGATVTFTGAGRLPKRPLDEYQKIFENNTVTLKFPKEDYLPLSISGKLSPGKFVVPGDVSSQYITGLLLALPILNGDSKIKIKGELESAAYVDLTISVMQNFGVKIERQVNGYFVPGNQKYLKTVYDVEGDYSQAAFWLVANYLGSNIDILGTKPHSVQGDKKIKNILKEYNQFNECSEQEKKGINKNIMCHILGRKNEKAVFEIDASQIPDLIPIICVAASNTDAVTRIVNAKRLRYKESDRIKSTCALINSIGGVAIEMEDSIIIHGTKSELKGGKVDSFGDHRIAMAAAIAALKTTDGVLISDYNCVDKSYPKFFEDFISIGGATNELNMGE